MCIICYSPAGSTMSEDQIKNSNQSNPDGFGWAVRTPQGIVRGHSMNPSDATDKFMDLRSRYPDFDAVYHARITTHGKTNLSNCHPFTVGDERTVLAHNGMLPIVPAKGDDRSDTKVFAEDVLTRKGLGILDRASSFKKIQKWMAGSKMVIMTERGDMLKDHYILNENAGTWDNGLWFSNSSYKKAVYPTYHVGSKSYSWDSDYSYMLSDEYDAKDLHGYMADDDSIDEGFECFNPACGIVWDSKSESAVGGICRSCNHCMDCGDSKQQCMCYNPKGNRWLVSNGHTERVGY
jgi:hypothetical protein